MIIGDRVFARTVTQTKLSDKFGNTWQYHSRSDAHSKIACWGILFDLLASCKLLGKHAAAGKVGFGVNHQMHDYRVNRKKNLDLVICTPGEPLEESTWVEYGEKCHAVLEPKERKVMEGLPPLRKCKVGSVLVALEAKACMTEHMKARPRLYDELSSSFQTILGDTNQAIAAALVTINIGESFRSPERNKYCLREEPPKDSWHNQPKVAKLVLEKVRELPRRSSPDQMGYDAVGVVLVECANDGTTLEIKKDFGDGTEIDKILTYENMIERIATIYSTRFKAI